MDKIKAELAAGIQKKANAKPADSVPATPQVTEVLEYKINGVEKKELVLDMPATISDDDIQKNKESIPKDFQSRYCHRKTISEFIIEKNSSAIKSQNQKGLK